MSPRLPSLPRVPSLPNIRVPQVPLPPQVQRILPPRTLTSAIPPVIRDLTRFAGLAQSRLIPRVPLARTEIRILEHEVRGNWERQTTLVQGFLVDNDDPTDALYFQYNPEEVHIQQATNWIVHELPGRSHPFLQWAGGGAQRITFRLLFNYTLNDVGNVVDNVNWIKSFLFPVRFDQQTGLVEGPHSLGLYMGPMFARQGLQELVSVVLVRFDVVYRELFRTIDLMPLFAEVSLDFIVLADRNLLVETMQDQRTRFGEGEKAARNVAAARQGVPE